MGDNDHLDLSMGPSRKASSLSHSWRLSVVVGLLQAACVPPVAQANHLSDLGTYDFTQGYISSDLVFANLTDVPATVDDLGRLDMWDRFTLYPADMGFNQGDIPSLRITWDMLCRINDCYALLWFETNNGSDPAVIIPSYPDDLKIIYQNNILVELGNPWTDNDGELLTFVTIIRQEPHEIGFQYGPQGFEVDEEAIEWYEYYGNLGFVSWFGDALMDNIRFLDEGFLFD